MPATHIATPGANDSFIGTGVADYFYFPVAELTSGDTIVGGNSAVVDELDFTTSGAVTADMLSHVSGIEKIRFQSAGANSLTLTDALVGTAYIDPSQASYNPRTLAVIGNDGDDRIDGSALGAKSRLDVTAGAGNDTLIGGAGGNTFRIAAADLTAADTIRGGQRSDVLVVTTAGTVNLAGVSGVEGIYLHAGDNNVTVTNANIASGKDITIYGGHGDTTVNAAGLTSGRTISVQVAAGGAAHLTGGKGNDRFAFYDHMFSTDHVNGGAGFDTLFLQTASGTDNLVNVRGIEEVDLGNYNMSAAFTNATVASATGGRVLVNVESDGTVDGHRLTGANALDIHANGFGATLSGGAGNDTFSVYDFALSVSAVDGGGGAGDILTIYGGTTDLQPADFAHVAHIEQLLLSGGGSIEVPTALLNSADGGHMLFEKSDGAAATLKIHGGSATLLTAAGFGSISTTDGVTLQLVDGSSATSVSLTMRGSGTVSIDGSALGAASPLSISVQSSSLAISSLAGGAGNDVLIGASASSSHGGSYDGGGGDDRLGGGDGADMLTGGAGADTFIFYHRTGAADTIRDFNSADFILFNAAGFDYNGASFDKAVTAATTATDITGADLVIHNDGGTATVATIKDYLAHATGGSVDEGVFVVSDGKLFHALDASFTHSQDVFEIASFANNGADAIALASFHFI